VRKVVLASALAVVALAALWAGREPMLRGARRVRALVPRPARHHSHGPERRPFGPHGAPWPIPGVVEAEDYDLGTAADPAYGDTSPGSDAPPDQRYRDDDVDIGVDRVLGLADVGWMEAGEWLEYTVAAAAPGSFTVTLRLATPLTGRTLRLDVDGADATGAVAVPSTGCWGSDLRGGHCFGEVATPPFVISAGLHRVRLAALTGGYTIDRLVFVRLQ
jgi:hypothetical protein